MLDRALEAVKHAAPSAAAPAATSAALPGASPTSSAGGVGADYFNFNATDSNALYREGDSTLEGHAGFGHVGPGGIVTLIVEERDAGLVSGPLSGSYSVVYQAMVSVGNDADWTGYGVDFSGIDVGAGNAGLFHMVEVRYSIAIGSTSTGSSLVVVAAKMV